MPEEALHFFDYGLPPLLEKAVTSKGERTFHILDLGCGDGAKLFALQQSGLLKRANTIVGVDLSASRIKTLEKEVKGARGIISDAANVTELNEGSFDIIVCSSLIEHVPNDGQLLKEIRRLLRQDGTTYISTVLKKRYGFWFRWSNGFSKLDRGHLREYSSPEEFLHLLEGEGLEVEEHEVTPIQFPILDGVVRAIVRLGWMQPDSARHIFMQRPLVARLRKLRVPAIGYSTIEVLAKKK